MASMQVHLFGAPQFEQNGIQLHIERRKSIALLAYLVLTGQKHSRDSLATMFWPENDQSGARANLRRELSRLKKELGEEYLIIDRDQVSFDTRDDLFVDVIEFQNRVRKLHKHNHGQPGDNAAPDSADCQLALKEAVDLYTSPFMAGFSLPDSPEFDEWQFFQAESLRQSLASALQYLVKWHSDRAEYWLAIEYARRWLALDNLHEPAHRQLMRLYALSGQQAAALRQYQECARLLRDELGVGPEAETRALYEAIRTRQLGKVAPGAAADDQSIPGSAYPHQKLKQIIDYATSVDGVRIAYASVGSGPVLVKTANWLNHLEFDWESPVWRHWLYGLAESHTLVRYDERGCGLSDWDVQDLSLQAFVRDLESIVDKLGLERFPLLGVSQGGPVSIAYAVKHPEKVSHLILYGSYARGRFNRNYSPEQQELGETLLNITRLGWGTNNPAFRQVFTSLFMPEATVEQRESFNELQRKSTSAENAYRLESAFFNLDVSELVTRVSVPTLILHAPEDGIVPYKEGEWLAEHIPGARFVTLESKNHILLESEPAWHVFLNEVNRFLASQISAIEAAAEAQGGQRTPSVELDRPRPDENPDHLPPQSLSSLLEGLEVFGASSTSVQVEEVDQDEIKASVPIIDLPRQATPFIGRIIELAEVQHMLRDEPDCRLLTIIGPGGIGKTRLAIQVATELADNFADGVIFVPLQPLSSTEYFIPAVADALQFTFSGGEDDLLQLQEYLQERQLLLVMDNFETLLEASPVLDVILQHCPGIKFLVTSRQALSLQDEWLYSLLGLPYPPDLDLIDNTSYTSIQLFAERARHVRRDFNLNDEWLGVSRICHLVEGIPLAIELAASWTRTLSADHIAQEIQHNLDFLESRMRDIPERHRSMQAVFEQSWRMLAREEQSVFKRLSIFRGGFDLDAAREISAASLPVLTGLVDKSLLTIEADQRYGVHELLRQYAEEQLAQSSEEISRIHDLHCSYYAEYVSERMPGLIGGQQQEKLAEIKSEMENIRVAWQWAVDNGKISELMKTVHGLDAYYQFQSRYLEGYRAFQKAAESIELLQQSLKRDFLLAQVLACTGWFNVRLGQFDLATEAFGRSQSIYTSSAENFSPPPGIATDPMVGLALVKVIRGEYDQAIEIAEQAQQQNSERNDRHNLSFAYYVLISAYMAQGDYQRAMSSAEQAYKLADECHDSWFMAYILNEWGNVARAMGKYNEAKQRYLASYDIRESFNDPEGMAVALNYLGRIAIIENEYLEAKGLFLHSLSIYQNINDRGGLVSSLAGLGRAATGLGDFEKAGSNLKEALQIVWEIQHIPLTLIILIDIAELYLRTGAVERGIELLTYVYRHPVSEKETIDRAGKILDQQRSNMPGFIFAAAEQKAKMGDMEDKISELLSELSAGDKDD